MSDFIYSSVSQPEHVLSKHIQSIYQNDPPEVFEYHGSWGSLAVSRSLYNGFQPLENDSHIFIVIGGPVLCFTENIFLTGNDPVKGSQEIYMRWLSGKIQWDEDLSGPFAILIVDKKSLQITCITDLLMFIPVFQYAHEGTVMLGTHVEALAKAASQEDQFDPVSLVDFILNDVVTYPQTLYAQIFQSHPAATHVFESTAQGLRETTPSIYWLPEELTPYSNINQAATFLRDGLQDYIGRVTEGMTEVAQFISGGEDSRALSGLLPKRLKRDAFIFLDSMNREGHVAERAAKVYGVNFHPEFRKKTHYLDILPEATDLLGSGQYMHANTLQFHKKCKLNKYNAVFGGFLSDTLLKGDLIKKNKFCRKFPFLFEIVSKKDSPIGDRMKAGKSFFSPYSSVVERQKKHLSKVFKFRPKSAAEWFYLWPIGMLTDAPNIDSSRRLFRSYEIFTCKQVVKVSVSVPTSWKLNRRLFNKMARPFLLPGRWLFHADGRLPYFSWWVNSPIQFVVWLSRQIRTRTGMIKGNQGPWGDWEKLVASEKWREMIVEYKPEFTKISTIMKCNNIEDVLKSKKLSIIQKMNFFQVLYMLRKNDLHLH